MNPIRREEASAYEQLRDVMAAKLVKPCILAGSEPGDVVLDPFAGDPVDLPDKVVALLKA